CSDVIGDCVRKDKRIETRLHKISSTHVTNVRSLGEIPHNLMSDGNFESGTPPNVSFEWCNA
ncbi:hypothetical protein AVEN_73405-1, partial [Araneus ventricosus]